ncbi:MAG: hypothetical protein JWL98_1340 [Xanthomonadaceae bacterium]|nr:hypothetical protein [Xanthomonadaceae bacterium]
MKLSQIALSLGLALGATVAFAAPQATPATPAASTDTTTTTTTTTKAVHHRHLRKHRAHKHHKAVVKNDHDADDATKADAATPPKP